MTDQFQTSTEQGDAVLFEWADVDGDWFRVVRVISGELAWWFEQGPPDDHEAHKVVALNREQIVALSAVLAQEGRYLPPVIDNPGS
jgi:hypothetical protein